MPERTIRARGGATRVRTVRIGRNKTATVYVVRRKGPKGGRTVLGPIRRKKG